MSRNRFVVQDFIRLPLSDGDWIEIKKQLNNGESKKLEAAGMKTPIRIDGELITPIDWEVYEIERCLIFLLDWSLKGADDKPVKISAAALRAMFPADFEEINRAIFDYIARVAKEKNAQRAMEASKNSESPESDQISTS